MDRGETAAEPGPPAIAAVAGRSPLAGPTRFADEWRRYPKIIPQYESLFRSWTPALRDADFVGRRVLDAGCGTGRNSLWASRYGAAEVVAFDVDESTVRVASANLASTPNVVVGRASIYDIPFEPGFDIALCIGVLHHLREPSAALRELLRVLRPGGTLATWVYAREGYTPLKLLLDAIRRATRRLPHGLLHVMTYPLSAIAFAASRMAPAGHAYGRHFRASPFWHVHSVLYDQLLPATTHYWTRAQLLELVRGLPLEDVRLDFVNGGSWALAARKSAAA